MRHLPVAGALLVLAVAGTAPGAPVTSRESDPGLPLGASGITTGTTVVTHGYQLSNNIPAWPFHIAEAIRARVVAGGADASIFLNNRLTGDLDPCTHPVCGPQGAGGETIIVFDWADDSNESGEGFSEAAAEALFADLVHWSHGEEPLVVLEHLHLIGHSRGTVVNSEVAERLIAARFPAPEHVTTLDPHDAGALREEGRSWEDFDVNEEHPDYRCGDGSPVGGVCAWTNVNLQDNYWRDQDDWPCLFDPDGRTVPGSADFDGSDLDQFCHSDVHSWYYFTINTDAVTHPETGDPPGWDWFNPGAVTCDQSARTSPLARSVDGYNFSRIGGGLVRCPDVPSAKQRVLFDFNLREGLVNGNFDKDGSGGTDISGWSFHGGGGPAEVATLGNNDLRLNAGEWRRHNRFLMPPGARAIRFCRQVFDAGNSDTLTVQLLQGAETRVVFEEDLVTTTDWQCFEAPISADEQGVVSLVEFSLSDNGAGAEVGIDDVRLWAPLFADGFESGTEDAWDSNS